MRRKDREMGEEFALRLIDKANHGVLSVIDAEGYPYAIPLSIVRKDRKLYFHSSKGGRKVESFVEGKYVSIVFVGETKVPELYSVEELDEFLSDESKGIILASRVFTTEYESVMVVGKIYQVADLSESIEALRLICAKYTPSKMAYFSLAIKSGLPKTNIYRVEILDVTAKRKKYDLSGEEMKWGRLE